MWRLLQNRIPSRDNLIKRGVLNESQKFCPFDCGKEENVSHLFFECKLASEIWQKVINWLNVSAVLHNTVKQDFTQFKGLIDSGKVLTERFSVIWFACIWVIRKGRNEKTFRERNGSVESWLEEIKLLSWRWLNRILHGFIYTFNQWLLNPMECIGVRIAQ